MVIVDTDVFIAAIRGNRIAEGLLKKYSGKINVSAITIAELFVGANNASKKKIVEEILKEHSYIEINKSITEIAIRIIREYNTTTRSLYVPDAFIAATCIEHNAALVTFNTKDFRFIKGLRLAR